VTGLGMVELVFELTQRRYGDYEFGPFRVVVPSPLRRFMGSDYHPVYPGAPVLEKVLRVAGVRTVSFATVPAVRVEPDDELDHRDDETKAACRLLDADPTIRGLYRNLNEYDSTSWLILADRLEELGCPGVAAEVRRQNSTGVKDLTI
jgi:hypothetical protein